MGVDERIVCVSNVTGDGVEEVRARMEAGKTYPSIGTSFATVQCCRLARPAALISRGEAPMRATLTRPHGDTASRWR